MDRSPLNIIFAGTPVFAAQHLEALLNSHHNIVAVYTQPDRPAGRGKKLKASPVKELALNAGITVCQPASLKNEEAQSELAQFNADVMVVVAYGLLLPKAVLDTPKHGCINVHGSILPRWRGAAPIQRAIETGDKTSGVTIMQMDVGLDTGDMLLKSECSIQNTDTSTDLHDRLCEIGPPALLETLEQIANGNLNPEVQDEALTCYAQKIEKSEANIDWNEDVEVIDRKIRAFNPFPVCYTFLSGERVRLHRASLAPEQQTKHEPGTLYKTENGNLAISCKNGTIFIENLQLPGKKAMSASEFINGFPHLVECPTLLSNSES